MKHETFNSILAFLGLSLAIFSTAHQFKPLPDNLDVTVEGRTLTNSKIKIDETGFPSFEGTGRQSLASPIYWKVRVYNNSDRPVSIVESDVFLTSKSEVLRSSTYGASKYGARISYTGIGGNLFSPDTALTPINLPLNIGAREAQAFIISLNIPIMARASDDKGCIASERSTREIENCLFQGGRDLFGNEVKADFNEDGSLVFAKWVSQEKQPLFYLDIESGDGTKFGSQISYFPNMYILQEK